MNPEVLRTTPPWEWPEGAGKMLLDVLRDERAGATARLLAAELAGELVVMNDELAGALLTIVRNGGEAEALRGTAAIALGPALEHADTAGFEEAEDIIISEKMFGEIRRALRALYMNGDEPEHVRRMALEASVRAPEAWHTEAVQKAYASGREDWSLTAVFCMGCVRGFNEQILESLDSSNPGIRYQAVCAAGNWAVEAAWPYVAGLIEEAVEGEDVDKLLLLAAIEAAASIRPEDAAVILDPLTDSEDEEIAEAVSDALAVAGAWGDEEDLDGEEDEGDERLR